MSQSLVRFMNRNKDESGAQLHWHRATTDGAPFRGPPPMLTGEEFDDRVVKVADPHNGIFDITKPDQNKKYLMVLDGAANGWFQILYIKRPGEYDPSDKTKAYVEWVEYYMEDGNRAPFMTPGMMEVQGGTGAGMVVQG